MKKLNEYTGKYINVYEVQDIWRKSDDCLYTVYKDEDDNYYIDAYDAAPSVAQLNGSFASDREAIDFAQRFLDSQED